jgi:hypothetical protein
MEMNSDGDIQRILSVQPLYRMRLFASLLGWKGLQLEHFRWKQEDDHESALGVAIYYTTTDVKFNLQINCQPHGQIRHYRATIKADRYGIISVGWHDFELHEDDQRLFAEVERLKPWLRRDQFKDRAWRRQFIAQHPELAYPHSKRRRCNRT